jgi:hypothetical protein
MPCRDFFAGHRFRETIQFVCYQVNSIPGNTLFYPPCVPGIFAVDLKRPESEIQWKGGGENAPSRCLML